MKTMTLSSTGGQKISTFQVGELQQVNHFPMPLECMESLFYATHTHLNIRDIIKG